MIVTFIEVFLEYLGIVMFMYKTAGKKFVVSKEFLITAFAEYIVVILSGRYIDNRLGMIFLYVMLFFFAKIKLSDNWKTAVRVFGTMLIGIPVMEILIYFVVMDFVPELSDYRWYGIGVNCIICILISLWKEQYIYWAGKKSTQFRGVLLVILFALFFFELIFLYKRDRHITVQVQFQTVVSVCGLVLVLILWMSSEMEKQQKQEELSLKQISRGQPRNKGHSKQAIFWWLKN